MIRLTEAKNANPFRLAKCGERSRPTATFRLQFPRLQRESVEDSGRMVAPSWLVTSSPSILKFENGERGNEGLRMVEERIRAWSLNVGA